MYMKKKSLRRLLNFILCVSILIGFLSPTVKAVELEPDYVQDESAAFTDVSGGDVSSGEVSSGDVSGGNDINEKNVTLLLKANARAGAIDLSRYSNGGTITLTGDVTASNMCQLSGNLTIDLNGFTMTMSNNAHFMLSSNSAILNIKDSGGGGIIYACTQLVWIYSGGTFNLYSGILDGSKATSSGQQGGCVNVSSNGMGTNIFNMYGGTIRGFKATQYGGAVYVGGKSSDKTPVFTMYGGTIENCYAPTGAAVHVDGGGGAGCFYIKGGTKQAEGGESRATIRCETFNGTKVSNAIYNYGYLGIEGVVDIDGIVYLNQNNWASSTTHFIKITGRLVVVGDGYIDIDSAYPSSNAICTGHTVVENITQTVGGTSNPISQEEFYTYNSYFINSTKGLLISAGFDPTQNELSNGAPSNWPTHQGDKFGKTFTYVDVMGQTLLIQASDSPGTKREMQNYNYLIYTERANPVEDYTEFYSIKISKRDIATDGPLDGATFSVKKKVVSGDGSVTYEDMGVSGTTGDGSDGVGSGETYIYLSTDKEGKLMLDDGTYVLVEETAPADYVGRGELATIDIRHKLDESTGELVSVVEVLANNKVLTTSEQIINSTYGDKGWLVSKEIVLYLHNSKEVITENIDYKIRIEKYKDSEYLTGLANAGFTLRMAEGTMETVANGFTDANGILNLLDLKGAVFTFSNGDRFDLIESSPPEDYYVVDGQIGLAVNDDNKVLIHGFEVAEGTSITMSDVGAVSEHGSWMAMLSGDVLTFKIYDEKKPPTWSLQARKYGMQVKEDLALAGAKFTLYKIETIEGQKVETEVTSAISSDGTDGSSKGTILFVDNEGLLLKFDCDATYVLRETYAPLGYDLIKDITIEIDKDGSLIKAMQNDVLYTGASYDESNRLLTLSVVDNAVYHMPETGENGIYPLVTVGILMMCISTILFMLLLNKRGLRIDNVSGNINS